eukprot:Skav215637  [mRNA]  locus=scaffold736:68674:73286:+ [translate_table: standard]
MDRRRRTSESGMKSGTPKEGVTPAEAVDEGTSGREAGAPKEGKGALVERTSGKEAGAPKEGKGALAEAKLRKGRKPVSPKQGPSKMGPRERVNTGIEDDLSADELEELSDDPKGCPSNLLDLPVAVARDLSEWGSLVKEVFSQRPTFTDLGRHLCRLAEAMPTSLGNFIRSYCLAAQPLTLQGSKDSGHGDLLPLPTWEVTAEIKNVTEQNLPWVKLILWTLNYHYCTGWTKPICVPVKPGLSEIQKKAIESLAKVVQANIITADQLCTYGDADAVLSSKKFDYAGQPLEYMEDLICEKILPAWPKPGAAAIQPIEAFLSEGTKKAMKDPYSLLLPDEQMPTNALRSRVRASDDEWHRIVAAAAKRGMMKPVDDAKIPKDKLGHLITNGAGAVKKMKIIDGKPVSCQRFISIMCPINAVTVALKGSQDTLPYIGQLTGLMLEQDESLYLESEDLQSAFNLFKAPDEFLGFFAYSKKVDSSAFGLPAGRKVRPALCVIPMGWHSAVALVQEAVRDLVFNRSKVPRSISAEKGQALPEGKSVAVVYLDNFDEIEIIKSFDVDLQAEGREMSQYHRNFINVCDEAGLPRNEAKQLIHAYAGGMQGGEFDGIGGVLKLGPDKLKGYLEISMAMLAKKSWGEFHLRHWAGKTAFMATFKRNLFAGMGDVFSAIEKAKGGSTSPTAVVTDEIFVLMAQSVLSQVNLRALISPIISCTDASMTGGGSATATSLLPKPKPDPSPIKFDNRCGLCDQRFDPLDVIHGFQCPSHCGAVMCCIQCVADHRKTCQLHDRYRPCFGERFSGPHYPLTRAIAREGLAIQRPLDVLVEGDEWNYFTPEGKERLEDACDEGSLVADHWGPECKTFSAARGRPIVTSSGRWMRGPPALRSRDKPWGLSGLSTDNQILVRQGNAMGRRGLQGVKDAHRRNRFGSIEHPWNSLLWYTPEAVELTNMDGIFVSCFSMCCFGGQREKWTCLVHNIPALHEAIHCPDCPGHEGLLPYEVHEGPDGLQFDTALEAEYPHGFCQAYAKALKTEILRQTPVPINEIYDEDAALLAALKTSTKGFQNPAVAELALQKISDVMRSMLDGERQHLRWLLRQVALRGCDIKLLQASETGEETFMTPYPAFRWDWHTRLSFPWKHSQHINILEVSAFLVEFRRRTRDTAGLGSASASIQMMPKPHLKYAGISERTLKVYQREVGYFFAYLRIHQVSLPGSFARLDSEVAEYVNHLYQEDEPLTKAGWLLSGLKRLYPRLKRELPISQQYYTNWSRSHTPRRAPPLTWAIVQSMVGLCIQQQWPRLGLLLLVGFLFFLRLGEILALEVTDFLVDLHESTVVIRIAASKTSPLAQQSLAHQDSTLCQFVQYFLHRLPPAGRVWPLSTSYFRTCFTSICNFFSIADIAFVPYSLRRGGATYFYLLYNSLDFVVVRGRWKDVATARIYLDDARASLITMRLSSHSQSLLLRFRLPFFQLASRFARVHEIGV